MSERQTALKIAQDQTVIHLNQLLPGCQQADSVTAGNLVDALVPCDVGFSLGTPALQDIKIGHRCLVLQFDTGVTSTEEFRQFGDKYDVTDQIVVSRAGEDRTVSEIYIER